MSLADLLATLAAAPVLFKHAFVQCLLMKHRIIVLLVVVLTIAECVRKLSKTGTAARVVLREIALSAHVTCIPYACGSALLFARHTIAAVNICKYLLWLLVLLIVASSSIRGTICLQASKLEAALAQPDA